MLSLGELSFDVLSRIGEENYQHPLTNTFGVKEWTL
jgi:hypothetical protein